MALLPQLGSKDTQPPPPLLSRQQRRLQGRAGALGAPSWSQKVGAIRGQRDPLKPWLLQSAEHSSPTLGRGQLVRSGSGQVRLSSLQVDLYGGKEEASPCYVSSSTPFREWPPRSWSPCLGQPTAHRAEEDLSQGIISLIPVPHELHAVWSKVPLAVSHERCNCLHHFVRGKRERWAVASGSGADERGKCAPGCEPEPHSSTTPADTESTGRRSQVALITLFVGQAGGAHRPGQQARRGVWSLLGPPVLSTGNPESRSEGMQA